MALFQVSFLLLPERLFPLTEEQLKAYLSDSRPAYASFQLPKDYRKEIGEILPPAKSWSNDPRMELWGDDKSDDFTIIKNGDVVESIELRVDIRKLDDQLLAEFLDLASTWRCVLVEQRHGTICRMSVARLRALLTGHVHNRAMKDPDVWLPFMAAEVRKQQGKE